MWDKHHVTIVSIILFLRGVKVGTKTKAATIAKQKYNKRVYDIIAVRVPKDIAAAFKAKCAEENIPQA